MSSIKTEPPSSAKRDPPNGRPPQFGVERPEHDIRRKRPPVLSFVLRLETARRVARVLSLLVLDYIGVVAALTTALVLKLGLQGHFSLSLAWSEAHHWTPFAYLVTVLMFARVDLYADRPRRPGIGKIISALLASTLIALVFALASGQKFSSYYIFYGSLIFGTIYIGGLRYLHTLVTGWLLTKAGYRRRALIVGAGHQIEAVAHALSGRARTNVDIVGYISLIPRPENGLKSLGRLPDLAEVIDRERIEEVILADPAFPQAQALELVDLCHERGVNVNVAPSTMEILISRAEFVRARACRCSVCARRCSRGSTTRSSAPST